MRSKEIVTRSNGIKLTIRANRNRFFFPDEWMAFYDKLKSSQKPTFECLINTGARIMEIRNIKVSDIDLDRGNIVLRVTKRIVNRPGIDKTGQRKIRILTISSKFVKYLRNLIKKNELTSDDYLPILSTPAANIAMKKALQKAEIQDWDMFSLHNVRKTLETWLVALDIDNFKIVKHFGHSIAIALKHYVSPDIFSFEDKKIMREIIGDLFHKEMRGF
jgi:integrase